MRRETKLIEGFDCRGVRRGVGTCDLPKLHGPSCGKSDRTDYGCHGDEWVYAVYDDENGFALDLRVYTDDYKGAVGELARRGRELGLPHRYQPPNPSWLTLHRKYPATEEELLRGKPAECDYVGLCYASSLESSTSVGEKLIWEPFANKGPQFSPQPEEFWRALEDVLQNWSADKKRIDLESRKCSRCDGTGIERVPGRRDQHR